LGASQGWTQIAGVILTFVAVMYSTMRASTSSNQLGYSRSEVNRALIPDEEDAGTAYPDENDLKSRNIDLDDDDDDDEHHDDETESVNYSYAFFHLTFATAACYLAMLITNWAVVTETTHEAHHNTIQVDNSWVAVWIKTVSGWLTVLLYFWTLIAPALFPDREF